MLSPEPTRQMDELSVVFVYELLCCAITSPAPLLPQKPDVTRCGRWFSTLSSPITAPHHLPRLFCREEMQGGSVLDAPLLTSSSSCVILILRKEKKIFGLSNCPAIHFAHCYKSGKVDSGTVLRTTRSFIKYQRRSRVARRPRL